MFITGIADEAAPGIAGQIDAHMELGWKHIELRCVDGVNLCLADDEVFQGTAAALEAAKMQADCFGAAIANWSRPITGDFKLDTDELAQAIPRMQRLGAKFIRVMSWTQADPPVPDAQWRDEAVRRMKELARMAEDGGVVMVHENCDGWGGQGPQQTLDLLERVNSPALKLVWDTGNPVAHGQDALPYCKAVREYIVHVHIKDYKAEDGKKNACYPGDGLGAVRESISFLLETGYDGGFSIEPHMAGQIHLGEDAARAAKGREIYIEYGRRLGKLINECQVAK